MLPTSRNEMIKTPGKTLTKTPGKTLAKTPGKMISTINRGTGTIKKAPASVNRFHSFNTPSKRVADVDPMRYSELPQTSDFSYLEPKQSIDNNTFNIMNVSASTEVEGPSLSAHPSLNNLTQAAMPSFSPLIRQIEATIDQKLTSFMTTFINQTTTSSVNAENIADNLRNNIKDAVVSGIKEIRDLSGLEDSDLNLSIVEVPENAFSSTVLRKPVPSTQINNKTMPAKRTNRRLMTVDLADEISSQNLTVIPAPRRSVRISTMHDIRKTKENVMPAIKSQARKTIVKNQIMATYLNKSSTSLPKVSKKDHKDAVMDIINTGSVKELKMLPTVGAKTAYQIVSHRLVKGKFKTLEDVKKALMMKDKTWDKFMEVNSNLLLKCSLLIFYFTEKSSQVINRNPQHRIAYFYTNY
jgi:DNA uptake protein ComE-like DNA-binding protein